MHNLDYYFDILQIFSTDFLKSISSTRRNSLISKKKNEFQKFIHLQTITSKISTNYIQSPFRKSDHRKSERVIDREMSVDAQLNWKRSGALERRMARR